MKKGTSIKDIDLYIPEQLERRTTELLDNMEDARVNKPEQNLYTYIFDVYEAEVLLKGNKIAELHCTCQDFQRDDFCIHIAALLQFIKGKKIDRRVVKNETSSLKRKRYSKTRDLLTNIPHEDLVDFVREYASRNRTFNLMLKAKFAYIGDDEKEKEDYEKLTTILINHVKSKRENWSKRKVAKLQKYLSPLLDQLDTYLATKSYASALAISEVLVTQILPICFRVKAFEQFDDIASGIIHRIIQFCNKRALPPEVKTRLNTLVVETIVADWYVPVREEHMLFFLPSAYLPKQTILVNLLKEKIVALKSDRQAVAVYLALVIYFSGNSKINWEAFQIPEGSWSMYQWKIFVPIITRDSTTLKKVDKVIEVMNWLLDDNILHLAIHHLLSQIKTPGQQRLYLDQLSEIWLNQLAQANPEVLHNSLYDELLDKLIIKASSPREYNVVVEVADKMNISSKLSDYFTDDTSTEAIFGLLSGLDKAAILSHLPLIKNKITTYMLDHFGKMNIDKFIQFCHTMDEKGLKDERQLFAEKILSAMPERNLLKSAIKNNFT